MREENLLTKVKVYGGQIEVLKETLNRIDPAVWSYKPGPDSWSIIEIVVHLADTEANMFVRLRTALAEEGKTITPFDQNAWAQALDYQNQDVALALEVLTVLRRGNHALLQRLSQDDWVRYWTRSFQHPESGRVTVVDWLDFNIRHVEAHLRQIDRVMKQYAEGGTE